MKKNNTLETQKWTKIAIFGQTSQISYSIPTDGTNFQQRRLRVLKILILFLNFSKNGSFQPEFFFYLDQCCPTFLTPRAT